MQQNFEENWALLIRTVLGGGWRHAQKRSLYRLLLRAIGLPILRQLPSVLRSWPPPTGGWLHRITEKQIPLSWPSC